jgi:hypothetical protein
VGRARRHQGDERRDEEEPDPEEPGERTATERKRRAIHHTGLSIEAIADSSSR